MDTTRTHDGEIIKGQIWWTAQYGPERYPRRVFHITEKNDVVLRSDNGAIVDKRVSLDIFRRDWYCAEGVSLREYMQNGKKYAIQIFVKTRYDDKPIVYGQLKL